MNNQVVYRIVLWQKQFLTELMAVQQVLIFGLDCPYANIGTHLGVTKMTGGETGLKRRGLKEAVTNGLVRRIHVSYTVGTGVSAKRRVAKLIVAGDKADTAEGDIMQSGAKIQRGSTQYDIISVYYPTRRRLG